MKIHQVKQKIPLQVSVFEFLAVFIDKRTARFGNLKVGDVAEKKNYTSIEVEIRRLWKSPVHLTPKWRKNTFFCPHVNWPLLPRFKPNIPLNSGDGIEATRAN